MWLDFRGIQDDFVRAKGIDYFENSRRATYVPQQYAIRHPKHFKGYGDTDWGIPDSEGPGPTRRRVGQENRRVVAYVARVCP